MTQNLLEDILQAVKTLPPRPSWDGRITVADVPPLRVDYTIILPAHPIIQWAAKYTKTSPWVGVPSHYDMPQAYVINRRMYMPSSMYYALRNETKVNINAMS